MVVGQHPDHALIRVPLGLRDVHHDLVAVRVVAELGEVGAAFVALVLALHQVVISVCGEGLGHRVSQVDPDLRGQLTHAGPFHGVAQVLFEPSRLLVAQAEQGVGVRPVVAGPGQGLDGLLAQFVQFAVRPVHDVQLVTGQGLAVRSDDGPLLVALDQFLHPHEGLDRLRLGRAALQFPLGDVDPQVAQ